MNDPVAWWAAFGALAQAAGALATFAAVALSLWIVLSERAMRARGWAGIMVSFAGDGTPGTYLVGIHVLNAGLRPFHVTSVGWRTGWFRHGLKLLHYRYALQNTSIMLNQRPGPHIVDPGREEGFYTSIADMKGSNSDDSRSELFKRKLPFLGEAPIRGVVNITGRKPLHVKLSKDLTKFLRTGQHASTTAEEAE